MAPGYRPPRAKAWSTLLFAALLVFLLMPCSVVRADQAPPGVSGKKVLILHSYYKGFPWTDEEHQGIVSVLGPRVGMENIYVEYLDLKRFYWDDYLIQLAGTFRQKYKAYRPDLVMVTDNSAFDFMRRFGEKLFPGVPVVFCGVNYAREEDLAGHPNFAGVSEEADLKGSLGLALDLSPGTRNVYVINDCTETGRIVAQRFRTLIPSYPWIRFTMLEETDLESILARLREMPPHSIVFHTFFGRDCAGRAYDYDRSTPLIVGATDAPVFGAWDFNLGYGIVGGVLTMGTDNGAAAARIALRILAGESPSSIGIRRDTPGRPVFDHKVLTRFHIPPSSLPSGSQIINLPESLLLRHRSLLLSLAGIVAVLVAIIAVLSANIRRRKRAEEDLLRHHEHLEDLVQERSSQLQAAYVELQRDLEARERSEEALRKSQELLDKTFASLLDALFIVNAGTRAILDCNPATRQLFGYTREELLGSSARILHVDDVSYRILETRALEAFSEKGFLHLPNFHMKRKSGEVFVCELALMPLKEKGGALSSWVCVIRDITEQRQTEAKLDLTRRKLRALAGELTLVEERERRKIATQLHDQLGAVLAMGKVRLSTVRREAQGTPLAPGLEEVDRFIGEAVEATRSLTWELSPPILYQLGLSAALEWLCEECGKRHGLAAAFSQVGDPVDLGDELRFLLFSSVRELLLNVVKHAQASRVSVTLAWTETTVICHVQDDGRGFEASELGTFQEAHRSFGLFNIQERVDELDGRMDICSAPGEGTRITLMLPFRIEGLT